jgi:AP-3 complex subunit beta
VTLFALFVLLQLIRSLALRVMCSVRVKEIVQIQLLAVKKCAMDSSPYVRKTAAHSISKIYTLDPDQKPELLSIVSRLLGDRAVMVRFSKGLVARFAL